MAEKIAQRENPLVSGASIISALAPIFLGSGATTTVSNNMDTKSLDALRAILQPNGEFGKEAAVKDSNDAVANAMKLMMEKSAPGVISSIQNSGGFRSSTGQLELNDLMARIAGEGAQLTQQSIKDYGALRENAGQVIKGARSTTKASTGPVVSPMQTVAGIAGAVALNSIFNGISGFGKKSGNTDSSSPDTGTANSANVDLSNFLSSGSMSGAFDQFAKSLSMTNANSGDTFNNTGGWDEFAKAGQGIATQFVVDNASGIFDAIVSGIGDLFGGSGSSGSSGSDSGCFITTAVCRSHFKPDDCAELTTLRRFRDTYMQTTPELRWYVEQYYKEAPAICAKLEAMKEDTKLSFYKAFEDDFIHPAIAAINAGDNEKAFNIYRALFESAKEIAFPSTGE